MSAGIAGPLSVDELILVLLDKRGTVSSAEIGAELGRLERSVRRRLRRLIREGYAFAPERGRYRITRAGRAVMGIEEPSSPVPRLGGER